MGSISVVCLLGSLLVVVLLSYGVEVESTPIDQTYRTAYHFQPPKNWINDPNGPMIYKGIYHLFYQYNPLGAIWGNIVWAHSTSTDLVNWVHHNDAIYPSIPSDINGCWSGSATILPGDKPAILYTGIDTKNRQVQIVAVPKNLSDPFLTEWVKLPGNPVMTPPVGIETNSFRDPTTAWRGPDGEWRVIIGSKVGHHGRAILYRSKDFIDWVKARNPLYSENETGMWECPDFFPVPKNFTSATFDSMLLGCSGEHVHVLKVSLSDSYSFHDSYTIGKYNHKKDEFTPNPGTSFDDAKGHRYDYGKYYASKTFLDTAKRRRILLAWVNESTTAAEDIKKGWSGLQAIPRSITVDKSGRKLNQWPVAELNSLRTDRVDLHKKLVKGGSVLKVSGVTASQADVEVSFDLSKLKKAEKMDPKWVDPQLLCIQKGAAVKGKVGPFGLLVLASEKLEEQTAIFFRVFKKENKYVVLMCSDQSRSSLGEDLDKTTYGAFVDLDPLKENLSLRSLIDHSIVESFGGMGRTCITARVYPKLAIGTEARLYVFNNGTEKVKISSFSAWSMKKAQIS